MGKLKDEKRGVRVRLGLSMFKDEKDFLYRLGFANWSRGFRRIMEHLETSAEFKQYLEDHKMYDDTCYYMEKES